MVEVPPRHPGGRTCRGAFPLTMLLFIPLTLRGIWRDRHNLREIFGEEKW